MDKETEERVVKLFEEGNSQIKISKETNISTQTVRIILRKHSLIDKKRDKEVYDKALGAYEMGMSQIQAAKYAGTEQSEISRIWAGDNLDSHGEFPKLPKRTLDDKVLDERLAFLNKLGINVEDSNTKWSDNYLPSIDTMWSSYHFFDKLGADPKKVFKKRLKLLSMDSEKCLEPKLKFLRNEIGLKESRIANKTDLFTLSLDSMIRKYNEISKFIGKEEAKKMFRQSPTLLGNKVSLIIRKIRKYESKGIDYKKNYALLEKRPEKVIETKKFLDNLVTKINKSDFYILLASNKEKIIEKIEYLENEEIEWYKCPKILILGIGDENKQGAIQRRKGLIDEVFGYNLPEKMNYKKDPKMLLYSESKLEIRIELYLKRNTRTNTQIL